MARKKKNSAPVSTRVVNGEVVLSKSRLKTLSQLSDPKSRAELTAKWTADALESERKNAEFMKTRGVYGLKYSDDGRLLFVNGSGTRGASFNKTGGKALIADIVNFTKMVDGLPE